MRFPVVTDLSKEQNEIFNLPLEKSFLVTGPPGTGKTVMALYRAHARKVNGQPLLLLMYNKVLSWYTCGSASNLDISEKEIDTFKRWAFSWIRQNLGKKAPTKNGDRWQIDWDSVLGDIALKSLDNANMPVIMIDEAQDIPPEFFSCLRYLSSSYDIFADENQRINEHNSTIAEIKKNASIAENHTLNLKKNYRNTREIAELASRFYVGLPTGSPQLPSRTGPVPEMRNTQSIHEVVKRILIFEKNNTDLSIGLVTFTKRQLNAILQLLKGKTSNPVQHYVSGGQISADNFQLDRPGIRLLCSASAKGLEFDALFIPELQKYRFDLERLEETKMQFYVLLSRARRYLYLSYSGNSMPELLSLFPRNLLEWK